MLSVLAGSIGTTRSVQIKRDFFQPSILWTMFVGESGTMKDAAIHAVIKTLRQREADNHETFRQETAEYKKKVEQYKTEIKTWIQQTKEHGTTGSRPEEPSKPVCLRHLVDDCTIEALAVVLSKNPRGVITCHEELSCWFRGMGEYKSGKGSDDAKWLKTYDATMLTVDRKSADHPHLFVPHPAVSVCGGIPPGILKSELVQRRIDSGCIARFWIVHPPEDSVVQLSDFEVSDRVDEKTTAIFHRLLELTHRDDDSPEVVKLSPESWQLFREYVQGEHTHDIKSTSGPLRSSFSKDKGRLARLALIIHMVKTVRVGNNPADSGVIEADSMAEAIEFVRWFKHETRRVYQRFIYKERVEEVDAKLLKFLRSKNGEVEVRDVVAGCREISNADEARSELDKIEDAGMGRWLSPSSGPGGGSPRQAKQAFRLIPADFVSINPSNGVENHAYADNGGNENEKAGGEVA